MGALSPVHWLVIAALLVLLFGYKRLPDVARGLGRATRILTAEVKSMTSRGRGTPPRTPPDEGDDRRQR
ncbi:MAG: Sec-independent protein translocase subunit TatA [Pseudonocardia sp.]|uniref:Sec-independent protein translocase subunit TatA n=1 Tax=Pseudonocardia sp. TaxID=60912 RepID=UPI001ACBC885|nr:Sec-independent protein translocase subunit TatA [Pseudonocardia sp.]MBN9101167.1 Sec-independent protein translocase subunit TatA [Pseudonocardia sp.]